MGSEDRQQGAGSGEQVGRVECCASETGRALRQAAGNVDWTGPRPFEFEGIVVPAQEYKLLRAEAIELHLLTWDAESMPAIEHLRRDGWRYCPSRNAAAKRAADRLVELGVLEQCPYGNANYRRITALPSAPSASSAVNSSSGGGQ